MRQDQKEAANGAADLSTGLQTRDGRLIAAEIVGEPVLRPAEPLSERYDIDDLLVDHGDKPHAMMHYGSNDALSIIQRQRPMHQKKMQAASMSKSDRLRQARTKAPFKTASAAATAMGLKVSTYIAHENGTRDYDPDTAAVYARKFHVDAAWLLFGQGKGPDDRATAETVDATPGAEPNVLIRSDAQPQDPNDRIPVYGQAMGGPDGAFVFNGERIDEIIAPSSLRGVRDAYVVEFTGVSMEPRYFAGEQGHVHPKRAVRNGDFVVVQIAQGDGEPPLAYVKQFVRMDAERITLHQFNPDQDIHFPADRVVSVHKIVGTG